MQPRVHLILSDCFAELFCRRQGLLLHATSLPFELVIVDPGCTVPAVIVDAAASIMPRAVMFSAFSVRLRANKWFAIRCASLVSSRSSLPRP